MIRLCPHGAKTPAVYVEMREINGIILFRRDLVRARGCRIDRYLAQDSRLGYLAGARAFFCA